MIFEHRFLNTEPRISRPDYPDVRSAEETDDDEDEEIVDEDGELVE